MTCPSSAGRETPAAEERALERIGHAERVQAFAQLKLREREAFYLHALGYSLAVVARGATLNTIIMRRGTTGRPDASGAVGGDHRQQPPALAPRRPGRGALMGMNDQNPTRNVALAATHWWWLRWRDADPEQPPGRPGTLA